MNERLQHAYQAYHALAKAHGACGTSLDSRCWGCSMLDPSPAAGTGTPNRRTRKMLFIDEPNCRELRVLGCGDCIALAAKYETGLVKSYECALAELDLAPEHDMGTMPGWCPLRGGSIQLKAEPYSLKRGSGAR